MSEEPDPAPRPLPRLAARSVALVVLTVCIVMASLLCYDMVHRTHYESLGYFSSYTGWQLYLAVAAIALVVLAVGVAALILRRRLPFRMAPPGHSRVFWTVVAIAVGAAAGDVADLGSKHVLNWASSHTAAAHRAEVQFRAETHRILGDATHPPVLVNPGPPAPPQRAALLLTPKVLGATWHYIGSPPDTIGRPTQTGVVYSVHTFLTAERWNGMMWAHDQDVFETATRYATPANALAIGRGLNDAVKVCNLPSPCTPAGDYRRQRMGDALVWVEPDGPDPGTLAAVVVEGTVVLDVRAYVRQGAAKPPLTGRQILEAAIKRSRSVSG